VPFLRKGRESESGSHPPSLLSLSERRDGGGEPMGEARLRGWIDDMTSFSLSERRDGG